MFKVKIVSVGSLNEKFYVDAQNEFLKRLSKFCKLEFVEIKEQSSLEESLKKKAECEMLKKHFNVETSVLLSINGEFVSSESLANLINNKKNQNSKIEFFIGGSNGVSSEFESMFKHKISLGKITLPHSLCKVVLEEQIYRAFTILNHSPYHK